MIGLTNESMTIFIIISIGLYIYYTFFYNIKGCMDIKGIDYNKRYLYHTGCTYKKDLKFFLIPNEKDNEDYYNITHIVTSINSEETEDNQPEKQISFTIFDSEGSELQHTILTDSFDGVPYMYIDTDEFNPYKKTLFFQIDNNFIFNNYNDLKGADITDFAGGKQFTVKILFDNNKKGAAKLSKIVTVKLLLIIN